MQLALLGRDARESRGLTFRSPAPIDALDALVVRPGCCLAEFADQIEQRGAQGLPQLDLRGSEAFLTCLRAWRQAIGQWVAEGGLLVIGVSAPGQVLVHTVEKVVQVDLAGQLSPQGRLDLHRLEEGGPVTPAAGEPWQSFLRPLLSGFRPIFALASADAVPLATSRGAAVALQGPAGAGQVVHLPLPDDGWDAAAEQAVTALAERLLRARPGALPRWVGLAGLASDRALRGELAEARAARDAAQTRVAVLQSALQAHRRSWRLAFVRGRELWEATAEVFQAAGASALQGESPDEDLLVTWEGGSALVAICERRERLPAVLETLSARPASAGALLVAATEQSVAPDRRGLPGDDPELQSAAAACGAALVTPLQLLALSAGDPRACLDLLSGDGRGRPLPDWRTVLLLSETSRGAAAPSVPSPPGTARSADGRPGAVPRSAG